MRLSIVVCTYNRADLLKFCLQSLAEQSVAPGTYEVLIIDNNSTDHTEEVCKQFIGRYCNFRYLKEPKQGLGHARNRGYEDSISSWVAYVDDDAKAHPNYVERSLWVIDHCTFDCFGGIYNAWYTVEKPKWIAKDFGTNRNIADALGLLEKGYFSGGNMVWKKEVLSSLGGFHTEIGMIGGKVGYGEETYIQELAREKGYKIGIDPELQIDHYVQPYKLHVGWMLKSYYATGRDYWQTFNRVPSGKDRSLKNLVYIAKRLIGDSFRNGRKILKKDYYYQNFLLDTLQPFLLQAGILISARKIWHSFQHDKTRK